MTIHRAATAGIALLLCFFAMTKSLSAIDDPPHQGSRTERQADLALVKRLINDKCFSADLDDVSKYPKGSSRKQTCTLQFDEPSSGWLKIVSRQGVGPIGERYTIDTVSSDYVYTVELSKLESTIAEYSATEVRFKCKAADCISLKGSGRNSTAPGVVVTEQLDKSVSEMAVELTISRSDKSKIMQTFARIIVFCQSEPKDCTK